MPGIPRSRCLGKRRYNNPPKTTAIWITNIVMALLVKIGWRSGKRNANSAVTVIRVVMNENLYKLASVERRRELSICKQLHVPLGSLLNLIWLQQFGLDW